jgi:hypothetical protein
MSYPADELINTFSINIQPLLYADLLLAHKSIEAFLPELGYERAAAYMYYARISQLRAEQVALQSLAASRDRLRTFTHTLEADLANLESEDHIS